MVGCRQYDGGAHVCIAIASKSMATLAAHHDSSAIAHGEFDVEFDVQHTPATIRWIASRSLPTSWLECGHDKR